MIMNENCMNFDHFLHYLPANRTRDDLVMDSLYYSTNKLYDTYFFKRVSLCWNKIPYDKRMALLDSDTMNNVKKILKEYIAQVFNEKFISDQKCSWFLTCTCTNCINI